MGLGFFLAVRGAGGVDVAVKAPLFERKRVLVEDYVKSRFALSYDDFLKFGKERFPSDMFTEGMRYIKSINLEVELIIAGFIEKSAEIYQCESSGEAYPVEDFAVIGEGAYLAQATLMRRSQNYMKSPDETLYNVYEAIRDLAIEIASHSQAEAVRLQRELAEIEGKKAQIEAALLAARSAHNHLANFSIVVGRSYQCPRCAIRDGRQVDLRPINHPIGADNTRTDLFQCPECGFGLSVPE